MDRSVEHLIINKSFTNLLLAGVRVGSIDGQFIANPTRQQMQKSDLNLVVSVNSKGHLGNEKFEKKSFLKIVFV
jgi:polyribonucleotide nucleotidyltransferase